jgi:hypothetical protein
MPLKVRGISEPLLANFAGEREFSSVYSDLPI